MHHLTDPEREELALLGVTTHEEALGVPAWVVGGEMHAALLGHRFEFCGPAPAGWDVHVGSPAHDTYTGARATPGADGLLRWRLCTETKYVRDPAALEAHGGELLPHPFRLAGTYTQVAVNGQEVLCCERAVLLDGARDALGNTFERAGPEVTVTAPSGRWATLTLEGEYVTAVRTPPPDRRITVAGPDATFEVEVPGDVTLGTLLAGRVSGPVRVTWDGKEKVLAPRALWAEPVHGDHVAYE